MLTLGQFREKTKDLPDDVVMATYSGLEEGGEIASEVIFQCDPSEDEDDSEEESASKFDENDQAGTHLGLPVKGLGYGGDSPWWDDDCPEFLLTVIS